MQDDEDDHHARDGAKTSGGHASRTATGAAASASNAQASRVADQMSDEEWLEALLELNPWARGFKPVDVYDTEFFDLRRRTSLERKSMGQNYWNTWAINTLRLKPSRSTNLEIRNRLYREIALVDFSNHSFKAAGDILESDFDSIAYISARANFEGYIFPGDAIFQSARFPSDARFRGAQFRGKAIFTSAEFRSHAWLDNAYIEGNASFAKAVFSKRLHAEAIRFNRDATFELCIFGGACDFTRAEFLRSADFDGSTFLLTATFTGSLFEKGVSVSKATTNRGEERVATFIGDATFASASFNASSSFAGAQFKGGADFTSVNCVNGLSLRDAQFAHTPEFTDATFHEPPRLDNCVIEAEPAPYGLFADDPAADPRPRSLLFDMYRSDFNVARDGDEHARFRKLRKMAADAKDHENELKFNGFEIAARRFWVDHPYKNPGRFWLGWLYGVFSNYGQSVARPLVAWAGLIVISWMILFVFTPDHTRTAHGTACHEQYLGAMGDETGQRWFASPASQAFFLSLRNASVIGQMEPSASRRMYGCLYGLEEIKAQGAASVAGEHVPRPVPWPVIPPSVTVLSAIQAVLSAVLLFLTGLGLRNTFRMK